MEHLFAEMYALMQSVAGELSNTLRQQVEEELNKKINNDEIDAGDALAVISHLEELQRRFFPYEGDAYDYLDAWFQLREKTFLTEGPRFIERLKLLNWVEEITTRNIQTGAETVMYVVYDVQFDQNNPLHAELDENYRGVGIAYWAVPMEAESGYMLDEVTQIV
jgi:hypothetical protein